MIAGIQRKLDIPAPVNPRQPVHRRPVRFHCIKTMQIRNAGMSTTAMMNVLMKMLPCSEPVLSASA